MCQELWPCFVLHALSHVILTLQSQCQLGPLIDRKHREIERIAPVEGCRVPELRWEPTSFYVQTSDSARCFGDTDQIMFLKLQCEGQSGVDRWSAEGGSPLQFLLAPRSSNPDSTELLCGLEHNVLWDVLFNTNLKSISLFPPLLLFVT